MKILPIGKLPPELLESLLKNIPSYDPKILIGPGTGLDCAVIDNGNSYLVFKSDPITFTADNIGWYAVQINVNDIVTTGATPKWILTTLLLPEDQTTNSLVEQITTQLIQACAEYEISIIGGHTEITHGIDRSILSATLIGTVNKNDLITPFGVQTGDHILLTKGIPVEATAIIAKNFQQQLIPHMSLEEIETAANFLFHPGISIYKEARLVSQTGAVTAMHDPTEGGLSAALWELSMASQKKLFIRPNAIHIPFLSKRICEITQVDPMQAIASGALLMTVKPDSAQKIIDLLDNNQIPCFDIGEVLGTGQEVWMQQNDQIVLLNRPERDDLTKLFES
ncbi:MAG: AIR synthase [Chloroflexi bacterium HGW-Chloroflexi-10]|nr:MAG: AIR synthase [Chloroflexi bacterium HGW-Chloroflexi-10]